MMAAATASLARMISRRGSGLARMCTIVPSSISAPSTAVPTISAITGTRTPKPRWSMIGSAQSLAASGLIACAIRVSPTTSTGKGSSNRTRRRPSNARAVIHAIVRFMMSPGSLRPARYRTVFPRRCAPQSRRRRATLRSLGGHQVGEDAFQGLVGRDELAYPYPFAERDFGQGAGEGAVVAGPDGQPGLAQVEPCHRGLGDQRDGEAPVVGGADGEDVRPVGHQPADGPVVAGRGEPAGDDHLDGTGDLLHLLQDVR